MGVRRHDGVAAQRRDTKNVKQSSVPPFPVLLYVTLGGGILLSGAIFAVRDDPLSRDGRVTYACCPIHIYLCTRVCWWRPCAVLKLFAPALHLVGGICCKRVFKRCLPANRFPALKVPRRLPPIARTPFLRNFGLFWRGRQARSDARLFVRDRILRRFP